MDDSCTIPVTDYGFFHFIELHFTGKTNFIDYRIQEKGFLRITYYEHFQILNITDYRISQKKPLRFTKKIEFFFYELQKNEIPSITDYRKTAVYSVG